jgi:hypothetical protein
MKPRTLEEIRDIFRQMEALAVLPGPSQPGPPSLPPLKLDLAAPVLPAPDSPERDVSKQQVFIRIDCDTIPTEGL